MLIGIDIDDVLYRTSLMIRKMAPAALRSMDLPDTLYEDRYHLQDRADISPNQYKELESKLHWITSEFLNSTAIRELKKLKQTNPEIEYCIVTWRPEKDTDPILQLLHTYYYFDIERKYCLPEGVSKAEFCEKNDIDILLDDCADVMREFNDTMNCCGILVSTEEILHNKAFAVTYNCVLEDWEYFHQMYEDIVKGKEMQICR